MRVPAVQFGALCLLILLSLEVTPAVGKQDDTEAMNQVWASGFAAFEAGNYKEAEVQIGDFIKLVPFEPSSRILMARCQAKLGDIDSAISNLVKATELGWEDSNSVKGYEELHELRDNSAFAKALAGMEENRKRQFVLYTGKSVDPAKAAPLIVLYHGRGELPDIQLHFWKEAADRAGWLLLALKGTRKIGSVYAWERQDAKHTWQVDTKAIVAETNTRINEVIKDHNVSKILLAGFSQGGVAATEMLGSEIKPPPLGAVLFATAFPDQPTELLTEELRIPNYPVIVHVGAKDIWFKGNQVFVDRWKKQGVPVRFRVWDGIGHQMPPNFTQVIVDSINTFLENDSLGPRGQN